MAKGRGAGGGAKSTKETKKRSKHKSKKHALRSATYAVRKLIDSAIARSRRPGAPAGSYLRGRRPARRCTRAAAPRSGCGPWPR